MFKLNKETKLRLMSLGIDANLRHYGLIDWFDSHIWTGTNENGKGRIRAYIPYTKGKKWRTIDIFAEDLAEKHYTPIKGDFVGFAMGLGSYGLKACNVLFIRAKQTEVAIEKAVQKSLNILREEGYVSPLANSELDFFGGRMALDFPDTNIITEIPLPQIQKAPKPNE